MASGEEGVGRRLGRVARLLASFPRRDLLLLGLAAFAWRILSALLLQRTGLFALYLGDAAIYDAWARELAAGDWIGREAFYQAPLYPYLLGLLYATLGDAPLLVRIFQALGGSAACVLLAAAGERFFGRRAGRIAGYILAFYPPAVFFDGIIQKTSLATLLGAALLLLLALWEDTGRRRALFGSGVLLGLFALTRETALILLPLLLLWVLLRNRRPLARGSGALRRPALRWGSVILLAAGLATPLLPVAIRNAALGGGFAPTTAQFGPNFYYGNNPDTDGTYQPLLAGHADPRYERADVIALAEEALGRRLSAKEVSDYWLGRSLEYIARDPADWLRLLLRKAALALNRVEVADTEDLYAYGAWSLPLRPARVVHFGLLLPLALFGMAATWRERRRTWLLHGLALAYFAAVVLTFLFSRYRFPLVLPLALFAGAGLAGGRAWLRDRPRVPRVPTALALVAAGALVAHLPLLDDRSYAAPSLCNIAFAWIEQRDEPQRADVFLERALELSPDYPNAHHLRGVLQARRGEWRAAEASLRRAIAGEPARALTHAHLADLFAATGRPREAEASYREALRLDARDAATMNNLAGLLSGQGRYDEALALLERAAEIVPDPLETRMNRALLLARCGRMAESEAELRALAAAHPAEPRIRIVSADLLLQRGRGAAAVEELALALREHPEEAEIARRLAWVLATHPDGTVRDGARALALARRVGADRPQADPHLLDLLAAALAASGDYDAAAETARRAADAARRQGQAERAREIAGRAERYAAGQPWLSPWP